MLFCFMAVGNLLTEDPGLIVAVHDHGGSHGEHHEEIRESQVHHKHVGWCLEALGAREDVADHAVANDRDHSENSNDEAKKAVPEGVHGGELVPVRIDHGQHVRQNFVYDGHVGSPTTIVAPRLLVGAKAWLGDSRHDAVNI